MMKKRIAMIMAAAMITGVSATTAFAEGSSLDGAPQMGGPQIPGGNENGQAPSDNGQQATQGEGPKDGFGFMPLEEYVKDGTISQETYDAITKYMDENKPELPDDAAEGSMPKMKEGEGPDLLNDLLSAGVITQEEYDALVAKREASASMASSDNQDGDEDQTGSEDEAS